MEDVTLELLHETDEEITIEEFIEVLKDINIKHPNHKLSLCGLTAFIKIYKESDGYIILDNEYLSNESSK